MHILFLDEHKVVNFAGGIEKVICLLANALVNQGHEVTFVTMDREKGRPFFYLNSKVKFINAAYDLGKPFCGTLFFIKKIEKEILRLFGGKELIIFEKKRKDPKQEYIKKYLLPKLKEIISTLKPDVMIAISADGVEMLDIARSGKKIPIIMQCHSDPDVSGEISDCRKQSFIKKADTIQVLLPEFADFFCKHKAKNIVTIPNPVEQQDEKVNLIDTHHRIISIGRLEGGQKRQDLLIEAFAKIATEFPEWKLELYGDKGSKSFKKKCKKLIEKNKLSSQVYIMGTTKDIKHVMLETDFIVFASAYEGFSMALTEAMALGVPVVAYQECRSIAAIVKNNYSGVLAASGVGALADAMRYMIENKSKRIEFGRNAKMEMQKYAPQVVFKHWEELLKSVTEENDENQ